MKKRLRFPLSILASLWAITLLFVACSEDSDCSMTARTYMVCNFYKYGASKNIILKDTLKTLTVKALGTDSILLNQEQNIHTIEAPLRYTKDTTAIVLQFSENPAKNDTVWVTHHNTPFFISVECGYQVKQDIEKVLRFTKHTLDEVTLSNPEANNYGKENLKFILR